MDTESAEFKRWFGDWERSGQRKFLSGEPVSALTGQEFQKSSESLVDRVAKFFADVGGKATHPEIGEVALTRRGVHDSISHGLGSKKAAAFAAVPDVIKRGVVIDFEKNCRGRGYDGYTIAAPISIAGEHYVAVVVVHRDQGSNRFYLQEVALTEKLREEVAFKTGSSADKSGEISGATPDGALKTLLSNIFTVKPVSKVVDAEGRPRAAE